MSGTIQTEDAAAQAQTGVRASQLGYLPGARKRATVIHPSPDPLAWELRDSAGRVVLSGSTTVFGADSASGDHVHVADFSACAAPGTGYTLSVGADVSHPFAIAADVYRALKYDALAYFYHHRCGVAISMPYAGGEQWTRMPGHAGIAPNANDASVTCFAGEDAQGQSWPGCGYTLDASGGWYDAGDHGKYVVNGGITVWTLQNQYERIAHFGSPAAQAEFADGTMNIPERSNGLPDLLDEARWELDFLLRMQVPEGQPLQGMAHHKLHSARWTNLPTAPHEDPWPRYLYPPSTAATLNLAAVAAQGARIWRAFDAAFADRCLLAAQRAWRAALDNPALIARGNFDGGGPYDDEDVSDEFYWAAAELFITTGQAEYRDYIAASPHFLRIPIVKGTSMDWRWVGALGTISLALVPSALAPEQVAQARAQVAAAADAYLAALDRSGYNVPFAPDDGVYPWGSNSFVLNNLIIIGLAHTFTGQRGYLDGVSAGMDYILGRNPLDQSYISGYGARPLLNPHHRFWANQKDPRYPPPPPGAISGGPDSQLQDPLAQRLLAGRAPQRCFVDHIESFSTNEVAINWNAPLAWVAALLDEQRLSGAKG